MKKRPLVWILAVWILGEIAAFSLGLMPQPETSPALSGMPFGGTVTVSGTVREKQVTRSGSMSLILKGCRVERRGQTAEGVNLLVYLASGDLPPIGSTVTAEGSLAGIEGPGNPGEFDRAAWYRAKGITRCLFAERWERVGDAENRPAEAMYALRQTLKEQIRQSADPEDAMVFEAVLLGDTASLDEETRSLFQDGGLAHIYAVSGLHLSLLAFGLFSLIRRLPLPIAAAPVISGGLAVFYVCLVGFSPSAVRALIMFLMLMLARLTGRSYDALSAIGLAGLVILLLQPMALFQAGFQLSFVSALFLSRFYPAVRRYVMPGNRGEESLLAGMSAVLGTMPLTARHFFRVPVWSFAVSLAAIPLASLLLVSALLAGTAGMLFPAAGRFFSGAGAAVLRLYRILCSLSAVVPPGVLTTGQPGTARILLVFALPVGAGILMGRLGRRRQEEAFRQGLGKPEQRKGSRKRLLPVLLLYVLMLLLLCPKPDPVLRIDILDIGQGDCSVIRTPEDHVWMIDAGSSSEEKIWQYRIRPFLRHEGVDHIDVLMLTHPDLDHISAAADLFADDSVSTGTLIVPEATVYREEWKEVFSLAEAADVKVGILAAGETLTDGGVGFSCRYPPAALTGEEQEDLNGTSLVLEVEYGDFRACFTGDIGKEQEEQLAGTLKDAVLLKTAHHGSRYSTSEEFLTAVQPEEAVISYGRDNPYGHPHEDTLHRLEAAGCRIWKTAADGAVSLRTDGETWEISSFRKKTSVQR